MKGKNQRKVIITAAVLALVIIIVVVYSRLLGAGETLRIEKIMETAIQEEQNTKELQELLTEYLEGKDAKTLNEMRFVKGYLYVLKEDNKNALREFEELKDTMQKSDSSFIKIYTYLFLNMLADEDTSNDAYIENCKNILLYMKKDDHYKNDEFLHWQVAYYLANHAEEGAVLLTDYLNTTKGLSDEVKVKIAGNIGQLLSFNMQYSEALFYYFGALYLVESEPDLPFREYYQMKLLTCIGDVNFSIEEYENAIEFYNKATQFYYKAAESYFENKEKGVIDHSLTLINICHAYLELGKYDEIDEIVDQLNAQLPYLDDDAKDDIEILLNNILADKYLRQNDSEKAQLFLEKAIELTRNDTKKVMWGKELYVENTYAKLCVKQGEIDEAILCFEDLLKKSIEVSFGLEKSIYKELGELYKDKGEIEQYSYYQQLYSDETLKLSKIFTDKYVSFIQNLYQYYRLEQVQHTYEAALAVSACVIVLLMVLLMFFVWTIRKWRKMSFTDHMTNLNNRKYLNHYLNTKHKKIEGKSVSILMIDIDYFKMYNDFYGHIKGDTVIREVANTVKACAKSNSIVIRYGGEEMAILAFDTPQDEAVYMAQEIQLQLQSKAIEHRCSDVSGYLTVSIGVYHTMYKGQNIYTLIDKADTALYRAKNDGRNCYKVYEDAELAQNETAALIQ